MMDAEQRLHLSMRSERQQRLEIRPDWHPVGQIRNEGRNGRRLKQAADRYLNIKARTDPADQTRRKQRVAPKRKEVVVNPNPIDPENLRKQGTQQLLLRTARQTTNRSPKLRRRKRRAVKLPVRRQTTTAQITARNTRPRYVKLPNNPNRHRLQTTIQYINPRVPYRTTNRRCFRVVVIENLDH